MQHQLDLYLPSSSARACPVVFFVHGGGWQRGDRQAWKYFASLQDINWFMYILQKFFFRCYSNVGVAFAQEGYACIVPSYRLSSLGFPHGLIELLASFSSSLCASFFPILVVCHTIVPNAVFQALAPWVHIEHAFMVEMLVMFAGIAVVAWIVSHGETTNIHIMSEEQRQRPWLVLFGLSVLLLLTFPSAKTWVAAYVTIGHCLVGFCVHLVCLIWRVYFVQPVRHPDHINDVTQALKWTLKHAEEYNLDKSQLFFVGHSAGAHLCSLLALDRDRLSLLELNSDAIRGVVGLCGVYDLMRLQSNYWSSKIYVEPVFTREHLESASPVSHVHSDAPPFLLINAEHDAGLEIDAEAFRVALEVRGLWSFYLVFLKKYYIECKC